MQYKVGDKIRYTDARYFNVEDEIVKLDHAGDPVTKKRGAIFARHLATISVIISGDNNKKTIMQKLSTMMKKLLDADTQTLVKAGYISGDLKLTEKGKDELFAIMFDANKAALIAAAQEKIAETK